EDRGRGDPGDAEPFEDQPFPADRVDVGDVGEPDGEGGDWEEPGQRQDGGVHAGQHVVGFEDGQGKQEDQRQGSRVQRHLVPVEEGELGAGEAQGLPQDTDGFPRRLRVGRRGSGGGGRGHEGSSPSMGRSGQRSTRSVTSPCATARNTSSREAGRDSSRSRSKARSSAHLRRGRSAWWVRVAGSVPVVTVYTAHWWPPRTSMVSSAPGSSGSSWERMWEGRRKLIRSPHWETTSLTVPETRISPRCMMASRSASRSASSR